MKAGETKHHIDKTPIHEWAYAAGVTETSGHEQLIGQTLRIHGKGSFEVVRIADGNIYLNGKDRPIPISVLTNENGSYEARRADGSLFSAAVKVVTGDTGAISQEELHQTSQPKPAVILTQKALQEVEVKETELTEIDDMYLDWDPTKLDQTAPLNVLFGFEMAKVAYVDPIGRVPKALEKPGRGFKEVRAFDSKLTDTQAFIAVTPDEKGIVIAFRGTTPGKDILTDLSVSFDPYAPGGQTHAGFQNYVQGVRLLMYEHLEKVLQRYPEAVVFGAGHSLGAAAITNFLGTAVADRVIPAERLRRVVLAGSPRGLDLRAASLFNRNMRAYVDRCVNASDVVTKVPGLLASLIASVLAVVKRRSHPGVYKHVGAVTPAVFFDTKGQETSDHSLLYRTWERVRSLKGQATDHFLDNYIDRAYNWAKSKDRVASQSSGQE